MALLIGTEAAQVVPFNGNAKQQVAQLLECTAEGELDEIHIRSGSTVQSAGAIWVAVYADNAGSPSAVLGVGKTEVKPAKEEWYGVKLTSAVKLTKGTKYWLGGVDVAALWRLMGVTGGATTLKRTTAETFTEPTESESWETFGKGPISIYGTGTATGGKKTVEEASTTRTGAVAKQSAQLVATAAPITRSGARAASAVVLIAQQASSARTGARSVSSGAAAFSSAASARTGTRSSAAAVKLTSEASTSRTGTRSSASTAKLVQAASVSRTGARVAIAAKLIATSPSATRTGTRTLSAAKLVAVGLSLSRTGAISFVETPAESFVETWTAAGDSTLIQAIGADMPVTYSTAGDEVAIYPSPA
jgi:hypothetical protein